MIEENPIKLLRLLKGPPLAILMAVIFANQQVSIRWISSVTGYSEKTVDLGIELLTEFGYFSRIGNKIYLIKNPQLKLNANYENYKEEEKINNDNDVDWEIWKILEVFGIGDPVRSELSRMGFSIEYIKYHIEKAEKEKINKGLFIYRLRNRDPIEKKEPDYRRY